MIECQECIANIIINIQYIILLVINSLGGGHTHAKAHTHAYRHLWTEAILRNQAHAGLWLACAWFKKP